MTNRLSVKSGKGQIDAIKFYLWYPKDYEMLFEEIVSPFLELRFPFEYTKLCYESISRESIQSIKNEFKQSCIFLFAYKGAMTLEYSYKLGLAHAHDSRVILINFCEKNHDLPICINFESLLPVINLNHEEDVDSLLERIGEEIFYIVSEDIIESLYRKAVGFCEILERRHSREILKVDKFTFSNRLEKGEIETCLCDYSKAHNILIRKVVKDMRSLSIIHLNRDSSFNQGVETSATTQNDCPSTINHYGDTIYGDKFGKDKVQGDKTENL